MPAAQRPEGLKAETVEAVLDLTWRLLDDERARDTSFIARAVGIAGFAGIIGALAGSVSEELLGAPLVQPWKTGAIAVFVVAMCSLAITVLIVILGVLQPRESLSLGADEVRRYPTWEFVGADKALVQGRTLRGLTRALLRQRSRNNAKASALSWAYRSLLVGLLAIVAAGPYPGNTTCRCPPRTQARRSLLRHRRLRPLRRSPRHSNDRYSTPTSGTTRRTRPGAMVDHVDTESPFANPPLMEGYPLDRAEREALERALDELDASAERNSHEAARTAQPPTGAAA